MNHKLPLEVFPDPLAQRATRRRRQNFYRKQFKFIAGATAAQAKELRATAIVAMALVAGHLAISAWNWFLQHYERPAAIKMG